MSNLTFFIEYAPLLSRTNKSAFVIYMFYNKFQDDNGVVQFTYNELNEHLGLATTTIQSANTILKKLNLIEEVEDKAAGKRYKLLPVGPLPEATRLELMKEFQVEEYNTASTLKIKFVQDTVPANFQQLLNKKVLKQAFKELGTGFRNGRELCRYFKIDFHTFKLLHEKDGAYKARLKQLMQEVESEGSKKKVIKEKDVKFTPEVHELTKYLYDALSARDAKPIGNWYVKNCNIAMNLLSKGGLTLEEAKAMIDWGFANDWWQDKMSDLKVLESIGTRYRLDKAACDKKESKITRNTELPADVRDRLKSITKLSVTTYEDAFLLKQSVLDGESKKDILHVVSILESCGIIPAGSKNLNFGS